MSTTTTEMHARRERSAVVEASEHRALLVDRHAPAGTPSARRPYRTPVRRSWFMRTHEYRAYALREFSSVVVGFFVFDLVVGLVSMNRGLERWEWWVSIQTRPMNLGFAVLAVAMSLVHATTWFQATPKIIKIRRGPRYVADGWVVAQHYVLLAAFGAVLYFWLGGL
jgi:fumarate reductase subunit C